MFEDLHWADDALLSFIEHLADRAEGVPLLIVGTARPELFEQHPDYAAGLRNANTINLSPLSPEETARLVSALLDASVVSRPRCSSRSWSGPVGTRCMPRSSSGS